MDSCNHKGQSSAVWKQLSNGDVIPDGKKCHSCGKKLPLTQKELEWLKDLPKTNKAPVVNKLRIPEDLIH